jgi:hypothetical protein
MKNTGDVLQVYALYEDGNSNFNEMYFLVLDFNKEIVSGLMFKKDTLEFECGFCITIKSALKFKRVGYIYRPFEGYKLNLDGFKLKLKEIESTREDYY